MMYGKVTPMFSPADKGLIVAFIRDAERRSGCEIIPVMARQSGRYDRGEDSFGVIIAVLLVAVAWGLVSMAGQTSDSWAPSAASPLGLVTILGLFLLGFVGGTFLATRFPILKVLFVSQAEMADEVERAAHACFYASGLRKAPNAAGILIYVSLFERRVVVLGDAAVAAKLEDADWHRVTEVMRNAMFAGKPCDGLLSAIQLTGMLLDGAFPAPDADAISFADELVLID